LGWIEKQLCTRIVLPPCTMGNPSKNIPSYATAL